MTDCQRRDGLTKTSFSTRHKAVTRARQLGGRAYRCPDCGLYHLTKTPKRRSDTMLDHIEEPIPLPAEGERRRSLYRLHYEGGATVDLLTFTAQEAVKLAARGVPEKIENLTLMDEWGR